MHTSSSVHIITPWISLTYTLHQVYIDNRNVLHEPFDTLNSVCSLITVCLLCCYQPCVPSHDGQCLTCVRADSINILCDLFYRASSEETEDAGHGELSMEPFLLHQMMATVMLVSCLAVNRVSVLHALPQNLEAEHIEEACPPCELLFSKLETTGRGKKLSQQVNVQQRGEPKSGTVIMYSWARAALIHACNYLKEHFGEESYGFCRSFETYKGHVTKPHDYHGASHTLHRPGCWRMVRVRYLECKGPHTTRAAWWLAPFLPSSIS